MLKSLKVFGISLVIIALAYISIAYAAPYFRQEASLVPIDSTENIGTSTNRWAEGWFGSLNISGTCTGCGSGSAFPFTAQSYGVSTSTLVGFLNGIIVNSASSTITNLFAIEATTTNATSTNLSISGTLDVDGLTSALTLTGATGIFAEYAGTSCTNQFVRSLDALGAGGCATVGSADVSLANLTATDATLTFSGTYNGSTARTIGLNLGNANTWTAHQVFSSLFSTIASSTHSTTTGTLSIPVGNSIITPIFGNIGIDNSSGQLRYSDVTGTVRVLHEYRFPVFSYSTTSWNGTTTPIGLGPAFFAQTWRDVKCMATSTLAANSFIGVSFFDASYNRMNYFVASGTVGTVSLSSNNTFTAGEARFVELGTSTAITARVNVSCTAAYDIDAD